MYPCLPNYKYVILVITLYNFTLIVKAPIQDLQFWEFRYNVQKISLYKKNVFLRDFPSATKSQKKK